jgi:hypothetical protein
MATCQSETVNDVLQAPDAEPDTLFDIGSDLETVIGKLECLAALFARLADSEDDDTLMFFNFMFSTRFIRDEAQGVFDRLHARACEENRSARS